MTRWPVTSGAVQRQPPRDRPGTRTGHRLHHRDRVPVDRRPGQDAWSARAGCAAVTVPGQACGGTGSGARGRGLLGDGCRPRRRVTTRSADRHGGPEVPPAVAVQRGAGRRRAAMYGSPPARQISQRPLVPSKMPPSRPGPSSTSSGRRSRDRFADLSPAVSSNTWTYAFVNPLVAVVLGAWLLDEHLTLSTIAGAAILIVSVALAIATRPRKPALKGEWRTDVKSALVVRGGWFGHQPVEAIRPVHPASGREQGFQVRVEESPAVSCGRRVPGRGRSDHAVSRSGDTSLTQGCRHRTASSSWSQRRVALQMSTVVLNAIGHHGSSTLDQHHYNAAPPSERWNVGFAIYAAGTGKCKVAAWPTRCRPCALVNSRAQP